MRIMWRAAFLVIILCLVRMSPCAFAGEPSRNSQVSNWLTVAANLDGGFRRTQFFEPDYNTSLFQWDSRVEFWLPPFRYKFSWGPYVRVAGIAGSRNDSWQNAWLGGPGAGFQVYPFSTRRFQSQDSKVGKVLGPLRVFGEYNFMNYWGQTNRWRPSRQTKAGMEYWSAANVNSLTKAFWREIWTGFYWQSSNEFSSDYNTMVLANAVRLGLRKPHCGPISMLSPYVAIESSRTKNKTYYWENRLLIGGGVRFTPSLVRATGLRQSILTRLVVYGEYLNNAAYYQAAAPWAIPRFDVRLGVNANVGRWYR